MKRSLSPTPSKRQRVAIYKGAAHLVETGEWQGAHVGYACNAIEVAQGRSLSQIFGPWRDETEACKAFKKVFSPGWANEQGFFGPMENPYNRNCRVVSLCFMAAMVEAGDA